MADHSWDVEKYRDEHESVEHWDLRKAFLERWRNNFTEDRLLCLARVFANIEFMGCRYPPEIMGEIATLSEEVVKSYRAARKNKLKRTFVSASDAAEDRARGVKRQGGVVMDPPSVKNARINFVAQGVCDNGNNDTAQKEDTENKLTTSDDENNPNVSKNLDTGNSECKSDFWGQNEYLQDLEQMKCVKLNMFKDSMLVKPFGQFVLIVKPWMSRLENITGSCMLCKLERTINYVDGVYSLHINNVLIAKSAGESKYDARSKVQDLAWNKLRQESIIVYVKAQWIAQGNSKITTGDITGKRQQDVQFGTPIESSVATKMMKLMGWAGGGLGADAQGIEEPVKPHLQMVNRAGLGSDYNTRNFHQAAAELMRRYSAQDTLDVDLVFSSEFSKEERAKLHQISKRFGLASHSYGKDEDRFLVVKKKAKNPVALVHEIIDNGGDTPKYRIFIPQALL